MKSSLKYGTEVQYDTSEESLQEFIHNLDTSAVGGATVAAAVGRQTKVRTPRTPTRSVTPLDEIKEERSDATMSSDDSYKGTYLT